MRTADSLLEMVAEHLGSRIPLHAMKRPAQTNQPMCVGRRCDVRQAIKNGLRQWLSSVVYGQIMHDVVYFRSFALRL